MEKSKAISSFLASYKSSSIAPSSSAVTIKTTKGKSGVKTKKHSDGSLYVHKSANSEIYENYKKLDSLGIGVHVKGHTHGEIIMKEVVALHKATKAEIPANSIT